MRTYSVHEPEPANETPVVVEVPHAGLDVDPETLAHLVAPARSLGRDADLFVDALYRDVPATGATLLVAHLSRYVVDLNRAEGDVDGAVVEGGPRPLRALRGVVWRLTSDGAPVLAQPLTPAELERRLTLYYRPYHAALEALLLRKRARFGYAILLCGHSMPSVPRSAGPAHTLARADVVPGTRGRTTAAAAFIDAVDAHARAAGLTVAHDEPYRGGHATASWGRPAEGIHAVQIELARRLYMDEQRLAPHAGFEPTRTLCTGFAGRLAGVRILSLDARASFVQVSRPFRRLPAIRGPTDMAKSDITGKRKLVAQNVSHSNIKTKRWQNVNIQTRRVWVPEYGRFVSLKLTTRDIRTIDKIGLLAYAKRHGVKI